jgi:hypothetical protein
MGGLPTGCICRHGGDAVSLNGSEFGEGWMVDGELPMFISGCHLRIALVVGHVLLVKSPSPLQIQRRVINKVPSASLYGVTWLTWLMASLGMEIVQYCYRQIIQKLQQTRIPSGFKPEAVMNH